MEFEGNNSREEEAKKQEQFTAPHEGAVNDDLSYMEELKQKQDDFLDGYLLYLNTQTSFSKNILKRKALELEVIDPTFEFYVD